MKRPEKRTLVTAAAVTVFALASVGVAYNSATALLIPDYVGKVEMDNYIRGWQDEIAWPGNSAITGIACPLPNNGPTCTTTAAPKCPRPGVDPVENAAAVRAAVAVVRVATVLYSAYKAQAGEPVNYEISYPAALAQLEGTLNNSALRTEWVQWVNANPKRLQELRRAYQVIPSWNIFLRGDYQRIIDPGNELSLSTPWNGPG